MKNVVSIGWRHRLLQRWVLENNAQNWRYFVVPYLLYLYCKTRAGILGLHPHKLGKSRAKSLLTLECTDRTYKQILNLVICEKTSGMYRGGDSHQQQHPLEVPILCLFLNGIKIVVVLFMSWIINDCMECQTSCLWLIYTWFMLHLWGRHKGILVDSKSKQQKR